MKKLLERHTPWATKQNFEQQLCHKMHNNIRASQGGAAACCITIIIICRWVPKVCLIFCNFRAFKRRTRRKNYEHRTQHRNTARTFYFKWTRSPTTWAARQIKKNTQREGGKEKRGTHTHTLNTRWKHVQSAFERVANKMAADSSSSSSSSRRLAFICVYNVWAIKILEVLPQCVCVCVVPAKCEYYIISFLHSCAIAKGITSLPRKRKI